MKDSSLSSIGITIKTLRKAQNLKLQELASKANVTAGLISRIENFRTVPSLPVLQQIAKALNTSMSDLVYNVKCNTDVPFLLVKKGDWSTEEREDSEGMLYQSVLSETNTSTSFKLNIVTLEKGVHRKPISNDAQEIIYVISGSVTYGFPQSTVSLSEGDTLYFDGSKPHSVENTNDNSSVLLVLYFMRND